jgi:pantetheine-phosphate adenylyltransferase
MNKKKIGIYAGSFSPFTVGHKNILEKAERILGKGNVVVAIGSNPAKTSITDFSEKSQKLSEKLGTTVISYSCFLHELILQKEEEGYEVVLVRGLRNGEDLAYEENQLKFIYEFLPKDYYLNTIFLMSDEQYKHISSSAVRQLEAFRPGSGEQYVV